MRPQASPGTFVGAEDCLISEGRAAASLGLLIVRRADGTPCCGVCDWSLQPVVETGAAQSRRSHPGCFFVFEIVWDARALLGGSRFLLVSADAWDSAAVLATRYRRHSVQQTPAPTSHVNTSLGSGEVRLRPVQDSVCLRLPLAATWLLVKKVSQPADYVEHSRR